MTKDNFLRFLAVWFLISLSIFLGGRLTGFYARNFGFSLIVTIGLGLINALIWPILSDLALARSVITFGLSALLVNGVIIWLLAFFTSVIGGSVWGLLLLPVGIALVNTLVSGILTSDNDSSYYHSVVKKMKGRAEKAVENKDNPGFIFLEIDGLAERVLRNAIENGTMPTLARWISSGTHKIKGWETDFSSQTGASQAGILHGNNRDIPAFRWVEKANGNKVMTTLGMGDASVIEARITDGNGLLSSNGRAIANLYSGDAVDTIFVYSKLGKIGELYSQTWNTFYAISYNFVHTLVYGLWEMVRETRSRYRQGRRNILPRLRSRGRVYYFTRVVADVFLREMSTYTIIGDIIAGDKDVVYTTFMGYDEVAHHCGISDDEAFYVLSKLDRCINRIEVAKGYSQRPYYLCVLSDHGQTNGATFNQRYGYTLADLVQRLLPEGHRMYFELDSNQDHFGQMVTMPLQSVRSRVAWKAKKKGDEKLDVIVLASGNLGLIYFTNWMNRMSLEEIDEAYPGMVEGLSQHEGVSFLLIRSKERGSVAIGAKGRYYLSDNKIEGENPLAKFGKNVAEHLRREDGFNYVPDILLVSMYDAEKDEVAAFEELIGSHGGVGSSQSNPFILYPSEWNIEDVEIVGAENVYRLFKREMANFSEKGKNVRIP
jgi:putative membrane protein